MAQNVSPTKSNLMATKKTLQLAKVGYDLLDRKRNVLIREMMMLIDEANALRESVDATFSSAYFALQNANITLGFVSEPASMVPIENSVEIHFRSVMGVELPRVTVSDVKQKIPYGTLGTNSQLDRAYNRFHDVKMTIVKLAEIENSVYRLAVAIKKTASRANALSNILIPNMTADIKFISNALEEKEREEFSRIKVVKKFKEQAQEELEELEALEKRALKAQ